MTRHRRGAEPPRPACPTPQKFSYHTISAAREGAFHSVTLSIAEDRPVVDLYVYWCACKRWHLTRSNGRTSVPVLRLTDAEVRLLGGHR